MSTFIQGGFGNSLVMVSAGSISCTPYNTSASISAPPGCFIVGSACCNAGALTSAAGYCNGQALFDGSSSFIIGTGISISCQPWPAATSVTCGYVIFKNAI